MNVGRSEARNLAYWRAERSRKGGRPPEACGRIALRDRFFEERASMVRSYKLGAADGSPRGEKRYVEIMGGRNAMHKIEDPVPSRVQTRRNAGP